jgi:hypothetical protein
MRMGSVWYGNPRRTGVATGCAMAHDLFKTHEAAQAAGDK